MWWAVLVFLVGLAVLFLAAEGLVRGSSQLALSFGISPLIVGMTIVAFATSMPEMMVSLSAAISGSTDIAAGNIIGSNIANIGLILGLAACLQPLKVVRTTILREIPFMLLVSLLLILSVLDGQLSFSNGFLLFLCLLVFIGYCVRVAFVQGAARKPFVGDERPNSRLKDGLLIGVGILGLALGAEMMVRSAVIVARELGVSELVIGITIIAIGTSLPELAASVVGAMRGEMDISVGNVIGSNIFNLGFVLGVCPMIRPLPVSPELIRLELPIMFLFSAIIVPFVWRGHCLRRWQGVSLLTGYVVFLWVIAERSL